jgi:Arc/MetJ family transcription regulator
MGEMKKITVEVDAKILASAQEFTGESIAETVRVGLRELQHKAACRKLLELEGKVEFEFDYATIKAERE